MKIGRTPFFALRDLIRHPRRHRRAWDTRYPRCGAILRRRYRVSPVRRKRAGKTKKGRYPRHHRHAGDTRYPRHHRRAGDTRYLRWGAGRARLTPATDRLEVTTFPHCPPPPRAPTSQRPYMVPAGAGPGNRTPTTTGRPMGPGREPRAAIVLRHLPTTTRRGVGMWAPVGNGGAPQFTNHAQPTGAHPRPSCQTPIVSPHSDAGRHPGDGRGYRRLRPGST